MNLYRSFSYSVMRYDKSVEKLTGSQLNVWIEP